MSEMLSDFSKFKKLVIKPGNDINSLSQHEDRLIFLEKVKKSTSDQLYKELYPRGSQPGTMYGLSKLHKPFNIFPKLRPILSAINTATYGWAKFLFF